MEAARIGNDFNRSVFALESAKGEKHGRVPKRAHTWASTSGPLPPETAEAMVSGFAGVYEAIRRTDAQDIKHGRARHPHRSIHGLARCEPRRPREKPRVG